MGACLQAEIASLRAQVQAERLHAAHAVRMAHQNAAAAAAAATAPLAASPRHRLSGIREEGLGHGGSDSPSSSGPLFPFVSVGGAGVLFATLSSIFISSV